MGFFYNCTKCQTTAPPPSTLPKPAPLDCGSSPSVTPQLNLNSSISVIVQTTSKLTVFHGKNDPLSNFWPCSINYKGVNYNSIEQAYHHVRALNDGLIDLSLQIKGSECPFEIKQLSRQIQSRFPHSQEMDDDVIKNHINLYVNSSSIDFGTEGENAIKRLYRESCRKNLLPKKCLDKEDRLFV